MSKRNSIKGILIIPENQEIKEVEIENTLRAMYRVLECSCVDVGRGGLQYLPSHSADDVWFDEEGIFRNGEQYMFEIPGWVPLIGNGLILGYDHLGNCADHTLTEADIKVLRETVNFHIRKDV